jgi:hypothetical protein
MTGTGAGRSNLTFGEDLFASTHAWRDRYHTSRTCPNASGKRMAAR